MIDVCLLLEGTYPYVAGGVATWVHQLITAMKDIRFGIVFIGAHPDPTRRLKYEVPNHVLYLKEIYLHDYNLSHQRGRDPKEQDYLLLQQFYDDLGRDSFESFHNAMNLFRGEKACFDALSFFSSHEVWKMLTDFYRKNAGDISFLDYFWTWRATQLPLLQILKAEVPRARVYHAVSTGYAGLLGAIARDQYPSKFFLTEHGIYTHERMLEITQANWIYEREKNYYRAERELSFFKRWWITMFKVLSHAAYHFSDRIFTLYEGNKIREIAEGAGTDKITVIPNGLDLKAFDSIVVEKKREPHIGLIGRVVSIKDVKTFIQAARQVLLRIPNARFMVIGPTDEEESYYEECRMLVEALGLSERLVFTGRVNVMNYYRFLDLVVLTSISEAQPYVILEANVVGIPVVATDVGACREMLEGTTLEDRALGPSGLITEVANTQATAEAICQVLADKPLYQRMGEAGRERVRRYYDQDDLLSRYLNIYEQSL